MHNGLEGFFDQSTIASWDKGCDGVTRYSLGQFDRILSRKLDSLSNKQHYPSANQRNNTREMFGEHEKSLKSR